MEKEILQRRFNKMTLTAVLASLIAAGVYVFSGEIYDYFQIFIVIAFMSIVLFGIFSGKVKFIEYQRISFHPLILRNTILGMIIFPVRCYFSGEYEFWKPVCNQLIIFYSMTIQIQLLYFRIKKINVFIQ